MATPRYPAATQPYSTKTASTLALTPSSAKVLDQLGLATLKPKMSSSSKIKFPAVHHFRQSQIELGAIGRVAVLGVGDCGFRTIPRSLGDPEMGRVAVG